MRNTFLILVLISGLSLFSQNDEAKVDSLTTSFTDNLTNRDIKNYLVTKRYCLGEINVFKLGNEKICTSKSTYFSVYVFWEENGKPMIKKIDNCGLYLSVELTDSRVLDFFKTHGEEIEKNPIKPYEIASKESGPIKSTETYPCSRVLKYADGESQINQRFDLFALTNDALEDNINYEYNNGLKAVELENLITRVISENDDRFRRHL